MCVSNGKRELCEHALASADDFASCARIIDASEGGVGATRKCRNNLIGPTLVNQGGKDEYVAIKAP